MRTRRVLAVAAVATAAMGITACGGGGETFENTEELWSAVSPVAACSDEPNFQNEPAGDELPAHSMVDCYSIPLSDGTQAELYGLVVENPEQLSAVADSYDLPQMLTGPNWTIFIEADEDGSQEAVDSWLSEAQKEIGGELS